MTLVDRIVVLKEGHIDRSARRWISTRNPAISSSPSSSAAGHEHPAGDCRKDWQSDRGQPCRWTQGDRPIATPASAKGTSVSFVYESRSGYRHRRGLSLRGTVDYVEQLGEVQLIYIDIGWPKPLVTKLPGNVEVKRGAMLRLSADLRPAHLRHRRAVLRAPRAGSKGGLKASHATHCGAQKQERRAKSCRSCLKSSFRN
jgi:multiple sugar transport system ATP-binding protein/alpha-glucoside transport system ATP-binding protein